MKKISSDSIRSGDIVLLGIPFDKYSSYLPGAAGGPPAIRRALFCPSSNLCSENLVDLGLLSQLKDMGDLPENRFELIEPEIRDIIKKGGRVIALGGDHAITYPIIKAYQEVFSRLSIIHLDAHPDLYHDFEGNPLSHASPFARIMEEEKIDRLIQVGIRTSNPHLQEQVERFGVESFSMNTLSANPMLSFDGPVYLSLDLDVLDPAYAPGVSHMEPGGMSTREVIHFIQSLKLDLVGADIVEMNPSRDYLDMTAMAAAKLLKELVPVMLP